MIMTQNTKNSDLKESSEEALKFIKDSFELNKSISPVISKAETHRPENKLLGAGLRNPYLTQRDPID